MQMRRVATLKQQRELEKVQRSSKTRQRILPVRDQLSLEKDVSRDALDFSWFLAPSDVSIIYAC